MSVLESPRGRVCWAERRACTTERYARWTLNVLARFTEVREGLPDSAWTTRVDSTLLKETRGE